MCRTVVTGRCSSTLLTYKVCAGHITRKKLLRKMEGLEMSTLNKMMDKGKEALSKVLGDDNWREAFTRSGRPAGFSFFCPRYPPHIQYNAGENASGGVFHCGALEKRPTIVGNAEQQKAERTHRVRFI